MHDRSAASVATALFGTEHAPRAVRRLVAGPLSLELDGTALRHVAYDGIEILRAIDFVVRDTHWGTLEPRIQGGAVEQSHGRFALHFRADFGDGVQRFSVDAEIIGCADGSLVYSAEGQALSDFPTCRTGFVVLHPLEGTVGKPVEIEHTDGSIENGRFPRLISPGQLFFDIRAIRHEPYVGLRAACRMEGDVFEMEDHRNWTDASFKTYVRPLALPIPYVLRAEERVMQSMALSVEQVSPKPAGAVSQRSRDDAEIPIAISSRQPAGVMPPIGFGAPAEDIPVAFKVSDLIRALRPAYLVCRFDMGGGHDDCLLADYARLAAAVGAPIQLELLLECVTPPEHEIAASAERISRVGLPLESVLVCPRAYLKSYQPSGPWPKVPPLERLYAVARSAFPGVPLGGGVPAYFTELNRLRPPTSEVDFVAHATSALVHAADDASVMETLEALPWIVATARSFIGNRPYRIGPAAIGMRDNPYGLAPVDNPENIRLPMARQDPRQRGIFGAAWYLGYAAEAIAAGVDSLSFAAVCGALGVTRAPEEAPSSAAAQAQSPVVPAYHPLRALAGARSAERIPLAIGDRRRIKAVAWRKSGTSELWLANVTPEPVALRLTGMPVEDIRIWRLNQSSYKATGEPDWIDGAPAPLEGGTAVLEAYELIRLCWRAEW